jgi:hypothetical protein
MNYNKMVEDVFHTGSWRDTRFGMSNEIIGFQVEFETGLLFSRPKMLRKLGWVEALQLVGGVYYPSDYTLVTPKLLYPYTTDAGYGSKIGDQVQLAIEKLRDRPNSRQAIVFIDSANWQNTPVRPCISSYQFMISNDKLDTIMSARSWDLVSGFIYDTMCSNLLSQIVASILGIPTSGTFAHAASGHVYEKDVKDGRLGGDYPTKRMKLGKQVYSWEEAQQLAIAELIEFRKNPEGFKQPSFIDVLTETS